MVKVKQGIAGVAPIAARYNEKTRMEAARIHYSGGFSVQYKVANRRIASTNLAKFHEQRCDLKRVEPALKPDAAERVNLRPAVCDCLKCFGIRVHQRDSGRGF
jgi:hypothetical protein